MEFFKRSKARFRKRFPRTIDSGSTSSDSVQGPIINPNDNLIARNTNESRSTVNSNQLAGHSVYEDVPNEPDAALAQIGTASRPPHVSSSSSPITDAGGQEIRHVERAPAPVIDLVPISSIYTPQTAVSNLNSNINTTYGPVQTINNNNPVTINTIYWDMPHGSNILQARITTVLQARHVPQAVYDAQLGSGCMAGTRVEVLHDIDNWVRDPSAPQILWLTGPPGTGKSTIAWTVCLRATEEPEMILGGSFFCSRSAGSAAQRDVRRIIPTLAQLLARQSTEFSEALAKELTGDPDVLYKQVTVQVKTLLYTPLLALKASSVPVVFVIDAVDECGGQLTARGTVEDPDSARIMSDMIGALAIFSRSAEKLPVKFLVASRPESHIQDTILVDPAFSKVIRLTKEQDAADVRLYISARLSSSARLSNGISNDDANKLVQQCDGLFIAATTVLHHTLDEGIDGAAARFKTLLVESSDHPRNEKTTAVDRIYALILADAAKADNVETDGLPEIVRLLAAILSAQTVLSVAALADLTSLKRNDLRISLSRLHAVVHVPESDDEPGVRILHTTFADYLFGRAATGIRAPESLGHHVLARACLHAMETHLHFNISRSRSSYDRNLASKPDLITPSLEYACMEWINHISNLPDSSALNKEMHDVFRRKFLFWLEVMSILGQTWRAVAMLRLAATTTGQSLELSRFFRDANSFVASSHKAIEHSAPHIYISALPFAEKDSLIYQTFFPLFSGLLTVEVSGMACHGGRLVMTLTGHEDGVNSVAYSSDGRLLCSGSSDGTVRVWDMRNGQEMMSPLPSGHHSVWSVAFAPNSKSLASGTEAGVVCIWSLEASRTAPLLLSGHTGAVFVVVFSPDGARIASGSMDTTVRLWSFTTGQQLTEMRGHSLFVLTIAFSPDGEILASGSDDETIRLWHTDTGEPVNDSHHEQGNPIYSISFSADGTMLAAGSGTELILCEPHTGEKIATLYTHSDSVRSVSFAPDGKSLVSADGTSVRISVVPQPVDKPPPIVLDGHMDKVRCVTFSSDGLYIASASDDHTIRIWNAGGQPKVPSLESHNGAVRAVAVTHDGAFIVSGSEDFSVRVSNVVTGDAKFPPLLAHSSWVNSVVTSPNGRLIASGSRDGTVRLWNSRTGAEIKTSMSPYSHSILAVALSLDMRWLARGANNGQVRVWNVAAERYPANSSFNCNGEVWSATFSRDSQLLAAGDANGFIHLWRIQTGQQAHEPLRAHDLGVYSIAFSPDGTHIVSGGKDMTARTWNIGTGDQVLPLQGHTDTVFSVSYSFDGRFIGTGSADHTVRLWDSTTGLSIATLRAHTDWARAIAFTPDGQSLVSGSSDKAIRVWDISTALLPSSASGVNHTAVLAAATLNDGWLRGSSGELLLWVPTEYHAFLVLPPCTMLIAPSRVIVKVGDDGWHHGESWTSCWREDELETASSAT